MKIKICRYHSVTTLLHMLSSLVMSCPWLLLKSLKCKIINYSYRRVGNEAANTVRCSCTRRTRCLNAPRPPAFLKRMRPVKFCFLVSCTSFVISILCVQFATRQDQRAFNESLIQEAIKNVGRDYRYKDVNRKINKFTEVFKYILLWTQFDFCPFYYLGDGQRAFLNKNCSEIKCYVTKNRHFFGGDLTKFDAIAFDGRSMKSSDLPSVRYPHQKYIFFNMESAENYPVCKEQFEGFFNWTLTYRLDSDIPYPYILVRDIKGQIVGPKRKMRWKKDMAAVGDEFINRIENKTKAAAWFVSNCNPMSDRQGYVSALVNALDSYGLTIDVYGKCGAFRCPRNDESCNYLLKRDYFFYMSMENSFDEDYVTEKVLTPLQHDVVPIVYGGADYSRFLPPGSYIDGRKQDVQQLAAMMDKLMHSPKEYSQYFRWKHHYAFHNPSSIENVCAVCEALHDKNMFQKTTIYNDFRNWWNPHFHDRCRRFSIWGD